jgi:hypothetical protein
MTTTPEVHDDLLNALNDVMVRFRAADAAAARVSDFFFIKLYNLL